MNQPSPSGNVRVHVEGDVSGQIAIGNNILQIGAIHGGIVNIIAPDKKPNFTRKTPPVYIRPHAFRGLLDRTDELRTAAGALRGSESVSIHGKNGLGKTTLLRHLAYNSPGDNFPAGIVYFSARGIHVADLLQAIVDSFYESDRPAKPTRAQLCQLLQNISALILLDDVAFTSDQVLELINSAPQCTFIFASIERCLYGEGCCIALEGLPSREALMLIERELGRPLAAQERSVAEAFCRQVEGHPLQLLQAAAEVRGSKTFTEIVSKPDKSEDAFVKTMLAQLSNPQRSMLSLMAASGNFPISLNHLAALTRLKDVDAQIKPLLDLHLVQAHSPVYNLTGTLALSLGRMTSLQEAEDQIIEYFVRWISQNPPLPDITDSLNLLLSLLERANRNGRWDDVISLGRGIEKALILGKRWQAWLQVLEWILKAARALGDRTIQGWVLHQLGTRHLCLGDLEPARQSLTQALNIRQSLGDKAGAAVTRQNLSLIIAPPAAPPRQPPHPRTGPAPQAGGSLLLKTIVGFLGIGFVAVAGFFAWLVVQPILFPTPVVVPPVATSTVTSTPTDLPTASYTPTASHTPEPTGTHTATFTPTSTFTPSPTQTYTRAPSVTPTFTPIPTYTSTPDVIGPAAPQIVWPNDYVDVACGDTVFLRWEVPYDVSGIARYDLVLQSSSNNEFYTDMRTYESNAPEFDISRLITGVFKECTQYGSLYIRWRVYAYDGFWNVGSSSDWAYFRASNQLTLTTPVQLSPADGSVFDHYPRTTTLEWSAVPGAGKYRLERDFVMPGQACPQGESEYEVIEVTETTFTFDFVGAQPGCWRVWAVSADGLEGPKSGWWGFRYTQ